MNNILLFITDATPYMVKTAQSVSLSYSKMIRVTYLAHALHRLADQICENFPDVGVLITNIFRKIFVEAPLRVDIFKYLVTSIPLPLKPVLTRLGYMT